MPTWPQQVAPALHYVVVVAWSTFSIHRTSYQPSSVCWLLQHAFQRKVRTLISQLHVLSREPDLVAAAARLLAVMEAKLVLLHPPLADALVSHGVRRQRAVRSEHLAPMGFIRELHAGEFRLDLRASELLKLLL